MMIIGNAIYSCDANFSVMDIDVSSGLSYGLDNREIVHGRSRNVPFIQLMTLTLAPIQPSILGLFPGGGLNYLRLDVCYEPPSAGDTKNSWRYT
jgi:hypothetical protein